MQFLKKTTDDVKQTGKKTSVKNLKEVGTEFPGWKKSKK